VNGDPIERNWVNWVLALEAHAGLCERQQVRTLGDRGDFSPIGILVLPVLFFLSCRQILGLQPRELSTCTDPSLLLIDNMEDDDSLICESDGRHGSWYTFGDGAGTLQEPPQDQDFLPKLIPGGRNTSRYAAHFAGSGFVNWGAGMGFVLKGQGLGSGETYNAGNTSGIKFWMKSNAPVSVAFSMLETIPPGRGGTCVDDATEYNCDNHFQLREVSTPNPNDWVEYEVPYAALVQPFSKTNMNGKEVLGNATFNPSRLVNVDFDVNSAASFDVWIDDVRFYRCATPACVPTCTDPTTPVVWCPAMGDSLGGCRPAGDCSSVMACNSSNTIVAPADGVIATFMGADGGVDIPGSFSPPSGAAGPTYTTDGILHVTLDAARTSEVQVRLVVDHFDSCVDATQFEGIQFSVSGSRPGCAFGFFAEDSAHLYNFGQPSGSHGSGPVGSHPTFATLTEAQVAGEPQTVMIPFASLADGFPATPVDKTKITGVGWVFFVGPSTDGGATSCVADLTIDDVRFY
jgi:hypothetical protein